MKWILSLFLCLSASAQLPVIPYRIPLLSAPVFNPTNINVGAAYWWINTDPPTNQTWLSWTDRIQGLTWTNGDPAARGTNSSTGMHFKRSSTQFMTNTGTTLNAIVRCSAWYTVQLDTAVNCDLFSLTPTDGTLVFGLLSTPKPFYNASSTLSQGPVIQTGVLVDIAMVDTAGTKIAYYTNGIPAFTNADGANFNAAVWKSLCKGADGAFDGFMNEIVFYTNEITPTIVSNLHYYRTNTISGRGQPGP